MSKRFWKAYIEALVSPAPILFWIVLAVLFAVSGAFGSGAQLAPLPRLAFWLAVIGASLGLGVFLRVAVQALRPGTGYLPASLVASGIGGGILGQILPPLLIRLDLKPPSTVLTERAETTLVIIFLGSSFAILRYLLRLEAPRIDPPAAAPPPRPRLLNRLPGEIAGEILHLSVRNHYVEVATEAGTGRLLMRFTDALAELEGADGLRVHRSHWVARQAVESVERCNGRAYLRLRNGRLVPVSRPYRDALDALTPARRP
ncbi:MAG: LytTR family transcriptional regulator [Rhodobacteraceae bacterium]|nr:LytTR family transcriptional regulator [Paracoccaceae bacterium]